MTQIRHTILVVLLTVTVIAAESNDWKYDGSFHRVVAMADRIVIRDGGFDGSAPVDGQKVLVEIKDTKVVKEVAQHIVFETNQVYILGAADYLYPGIDWYQGTNRVALTAYHAHIGLKWKDFPGVAILTKDSLTWLADWLLRQINKGPHDEIEQEEEPANQVPENIGTNAPNSQH